MSENLVQFPEAFAQRISKMIGFEPPVSGTAANGWFGGYGCRWCAASRAWFTVVPFDQLQVAEKVAQMFREAGVLDVRINNEGGVSQEDDGKGLQVSAYV
ncbi:Conserved hypothetical protein (plasmid) [Pseudomonas veronii 1YdBTEX2]|uniref:Uncharacterized protein n=2 Tax=Pseudomonas veronii TaxID=76761 RepID=A0A7Y1FC82_PSEVE|nr:MULTISPECIES: hypothetical protein [Pseudomonas]KAA0946231.1 hypothetical protein FQ182_13695 [Pseudomonas sp. ANT_H4]KAA0947131.1 hypothetical protein FQ186_25850 [Pseudomonas sp. ANT_H14]NMY12444.1 hypothetical protein [Pseudomonas veronii]SBW85285.1 Conserved hypothetical protein [Pseudomonas veronii 1YdBTEX2]